MKLLFLPLSLSLQSFALFEEKQLANKASAFSIMSKLSHHFVRAIILSILHV